VAPALTGIALVVVLVLAAVAGLGLVVGLFQISRRPPAQ
jgi:nitrate reductase NapE component